MRFLFFALLGAIALLNGCGGTIALRNDNDAAQEVIRDAPFAAKGRFSARIEEEAFVASFDWQHTPQHDSIELISPLGTRVALLERNAQEVIIRQGEAENATWRGQDLQKLTQDALGFPLPVNGLIYWIRGAPMPQINAGITRDAQGRLEQLRQDGWEMSYRYAQSDASRPLQIDARYGETISLRIRIDEWAECDAAQ